MNSLSLDDGNCADYHASTTASGLVAEEGGESVGRSKSLAVAFYLLACLALVASLATTAALPQTAEAQAYPPSPWILIDTDPDEAGPGNNYRDVWRAYFGYDSTHLYLRLETYDTPLFPAVGTRFKWLIDVGTGNNLYWSGQNVLGADFLLFVEDSDNDGGRDVYLLDSQGNDRFTQYEPEVYETAPGPIIDTSVAGFSQSGNNIDLWVSYIALGISDPTHVSLLWSTDQENPNLEQGPVLDSTDVSDTPLHVDADLNIMKDVSDHFPAVLARITYTVTLANTGPADATNIQVSDVLPNGVTYFSHSATLGNYSSATDIWYIDSLADGGSATLTVTVDVDNGTGGQTLTNTATVLAVDQPDPHPGDNSDIVSIYPGGAPPGLADIHVQKEVSSHVRNEGDTVTYTVTVTNTGPDLATAVQVPDPLPGGVTYVTHSASQGSYNSGTDVWSLGDLADGSSATLAITATVNGGTAGSTITNTATATAASPGDPHDGDNSDTAEFFVSQAPGPVSTAIAPVFPNLYIGMAAVFAAAVLAFALRPKLAPRGPDPHYRSQNPPRKRRS